MVVAGDPDVGVLVVDRLDEQAVRAVEALAGRAAEADGRPALSDHTALHLRGGGDVGAWHLLARDGGGQVVGYAHLDPSDPVEGPSGEVVVDPRARGRGVGDRLLHRVVALAQSEAGRAVRLWAHGDAPAAARLARRHGFTRSRVLLQMRRGLAAPLPQPRVPDRVVVRTFRPGDDDQAWLEVNAQAFAHHPEQGAWTHGDLRARQAEPWFDPEGFFLAHRRDDDRLVGFHWTKRHGDGAGTGHGHAPLGEVYVVGVLPEEQGDGLGRALTLVGLQHLRDAGLPEAMLYVDEANDAAVRLYRRLGFRRHETDVMWRRPTT